MGATPSSTGKTNYQEKKKKRERKKAIELFFICIEAGAVDQVQDLLKKDPTLLHETPPNTLPNLISPFAPLTPIHIATAKCHHALVRVLLKIDPTLANLYRMGQIGDTLGVGEYPLQSSALYTLPINAGGGSDYIFKLLLESNADVNCASSKFHSVPVIKALGNSRMDFVKLLLDNKADISTQVCRPDVDHTGMNCLQALLCFYNSELTDWVKLFIEKGSDPNFVNTSNENSLHIAVRRNLVDVIPLLLAAGADTRTLNTSGQTPLQIFCSNPNNLAVLDSLINAGADLSFQDAYGNNLLHIICASYASSEEVIYKIIDYGFDPNVKNNSNQSAYDIALANGMKPAFMAMLKKHGHINENIITPPLIRCITLGWTDIVEILVEMGVDVNCQDTGSRLSALHYGCTYRNPDLVTKLIVAGANVNIQDNNGDTPLHYSIQLGYEDMVKILLEAGTNLELKNLSGLTPFMKCVTATMKALVSPYEIEK